MATDIGIRIGADGEAEFTRSLKTINGEIKALGAELKAVQLEFANNANSQEAFAARNDVLARSVDLAREKMTHLEGTLGTAKEKLAQLGQQAKEAALAYGEDSREAQIATARYDQQRNSVAYLERQYQTARAQVAGFSSAMEDVGDAANEANQQLGAQDVLAGVATWDLIKSGVNAVTDAIGDAIQTSMSFDTAVADIAATMGTTVDSLGDLRGFAQEMGATTAFTATEAAQALNYMALAGYDAETAMETLPNVLNLAAAGGVELATASDMVTDAQSALGLSLEQTAVLVDEMAKASTKTNTSVAQLGEAILTVGGTAKFMAGGTGELNQVLGLLADNSIKGAEGGTKLRNIILSLSSPTEKAAKTLDSLGVSIFDAEGKMREFSEIFPELNRALGDLTSEEQITALSEIFNSRDIAAAQALLGTTVERWDELAAAIDNAEGSARQMAETRLDNLAGDITLLQSAADGAKIALGDSLTPALREVAQAGTGILTFVGDFISDVPATGPVIAGLTTGLGSLAIGMGATTAAATLTGGAVTSLSGAIGLLTTSILASPLAPWALGLGVVVAAVTAFSGAATDAEIRINDLTDSMENLIDKESRSEEEKERLIALVDELNAAVPGLGLEYDYLSDSLNMTSEEIKSVLAAQQQEIDGLEAATEAVEDNEESMESMGEAAETLAETLAALEESTLYAAGAADTLTDALKEQEKEGSLSLETTNKLIDAGYGAAIAIDEETGAVTLNREEYVKLASAKIQEQIATLEAEQASLKAKAALEFEATSAYNAGSAYWEAAKAKAAMETAGDAQALELQIAALKRAQSSLTSYSGASSTAARASSSASKKIKTQAEKDLAEFKSLKAQLDHEQAMGLIQDQEYYTKLAQLRDQYLTDSANVDQYRKVSETIYKADEKALQEREKLWQTAGDNIIKLEEDFQKELSSRAQEIVNSYKLFDEVPEYQKASGQELISNLEDQISAIQGFYENIAALEERGVNAALVEDIRSMGVKASGELSGLLDLTDEQLSRYSELYGEKQALANRIAMDELEDLRLQTNEEILGQLEHVADLYDTNAPALGMAFAENLAAGMFEGMGAVEAMAQTVANAAMSAFENTFNRDVEAMMTASGNRSVTRDDIGELLAGAVNGINAGGAGYTPQPANITIQTRDGIEIARAFLPDIRTADRESPLTLDDT